MEQLRNKHVGNSKPGGQFATHNRSESDVQLQGRPHADSSPRDIDTELSRLYNDEAGIRQHIDLKTRRAEHYRKSLSSAYRPLNADRLEEQLVEIDADIQAQKVLIKQIREQAKPLEQEYDARGGWSRFYLVQNTGGHVHSSTSCTTCFPTPRYGWLTDNSGMSHEEIVELAGDAACTVCFENAPVADRNAPKTNRLETPNAREAREKKQAEKTARAAAAAAKGITAPDGSPLKDINGMVIKSERSAEISAVQTMVYVLADERVRRIPNREYAEQQRASVEACLEALAHKRGTTVDEQRELVSAKAEKKFKKEWQ